jgi:hypothetical protein
MASRKLTAYGRAMNTSFLFLSMTTAIVPLISSAAPIDSGILSFAQHTRTYLLALKSNYVRLLMDSGVSMHSRDENLGIRSRAILEPLSYLEPSVRERHRTNCCGFVSWKLTVAHVR